MMRATLLVIATFLLAACEPEVGTKEWCEMMANKPGGSWSMDDLSSYAKHCIINKFE